MQFAKCAAAFMLITQIIQYDAGWEQYFSFSCAYAVETCATTSGSTGNPLGAVIAYMQHPAL